MFFFLDAFFQALVLLFFFFFGSFYSTQRLKQEILIHGENKDYDSLPLKKARVNKRSTGTIPFFLLDRE